MSLNTKERAQGILDEIRNIQEYTTTDEGETSLILSLLEDQLRAAYALGVQSMEHGEWDGPTEEEVRENGVTPLAITGPGLYRTASGQQARITEPMHHQDTSQWFGEVFGPGGPAWNKWEEDGTDYEGYHPWMIVARIED